MENMTSDMVLDGIYRRHKSPEWSNFAEVGISDSRRVDAVCVNTWASTGFAVHGFEIKVSRSDFLNEMKDISKWQKFGQFCNFFWLAAPKGLVDVSELPEKWGLMELQKNGLRIKKQAPQLDQKPISNLFLAALLRNQTNRLQRSIDQQAEKIAEIKANGRMREIQCQEERLERDRSELNKAQSEFENEFGINCRHFRGGEIKQAVKIAKKLIYHTGGIRSICQLIHAAKQAAIEAQEIKDFFDNIKEKTIEEAKNNEPFETIEQLKENK